MSALALPLRSHNITYFGLGDIDLARADMRTAIEQVRRGLPSNPGPRPIVEPRVSDQLVSGVPAAVWKNADRLSSWDSVWGWYRVVGSWAVMSIGVLGATWVGAALVFGETGSPELLKLFGGFAAAGLPGTLYSAYEVRSAAKAKRIVGDTLASAEFEAKRLASDAPREQQMQALAAWQAAPKPVPEDVDLDSFRPILDLLRCNPDPEINSALAEEIQASGIMAQVEGFTAQYKRFGQQIVAPLKNQLRAATDSSASVTCY